MRQSNGQNLFLGFLFILFFQQTALGQQKQALSTYLSQIESRFDIRFSYAPEAVNTISITPTNSENLTAVLEYIKARTSLQIKQINERYYSISSPNSIQLLVLDAVTRQPLANASVRIESLGVGYTTNQNGSVYIDNPTNPVNAQIQYLGYADQDLRLVPGVFGSFVVEMQLQIDQLSEVVLQPVFTQGIYRANDGSYRFGTEEFGLLPGIAETDVFQISQTLPGVESVDETVSNINIRGGSNGENLLTWDNIRVYQSGHFYGLISAINPFITEDVTIYRNGTHSRYGENVSGVIALKAQDEIAQKINGKATLNLLHANVFLDIPLVDKLSLMISGRRSLNDLYQTPIYNSYSERVFQDTEITNVATPNDQSELTAQEDFNFFDVSAKIAYNPTDKDKIRLNFLLINNELRFEQNITNNVFELNETSQLDQESLASGLSWSRAWNSKWTSDFNIYRSQYNLDSQNFDLFTTTSDSQGNEVITFSGRGQVTYKPRRNLQLEVGYEFVETGITNSDQTIDPEFRRRVKDVLVGHNLYNQLSWNPFGGKTQLNGGVRISHYPKLDAYRFEPRFNMHQKLGGGFAAEFHGELKSQSISQAIAFQNEFLGVENRRWIQANEDDIPLMTSQQWSTGLVWNRNNWLVTAEYFDKKVADITAATQGFQNQFANRDAIGSYRIRGLELVVNKRWKQLGAWLGYTYSDNNYTFKDFEPQNFASNLDIMHSLRAAVSYELGNLSTVFGFQWRSGKPFTLPLGAALSTTQNNPIIPYAAPNEQRLASYFRADLSFKYLLIKKESYDLQINAAFQNIFNSRNILDRYFVSQQTGEDQFTISQIENRSLQFTPNFSVALTF